MTENEREFYEERAAILEHEAGMTKEAAERFALELTARRFGVAKSPPDDVVLPSPSSREKHDGRTGR